MAETKCNRCDTVLSDLESHFGTELLPGYCIASRAEYARLEGGNGFGLVVRTVLVKHAQRAARMTGG